MSDRRPADDSDGSWLSRISNRQAILAFLTALVIGVAWSALTGGNGSSPPPESRPAAQPTERYLDFMRDRIDGAAGRTDRELIEGGRQLCRNLDGIASVDELSTAAFVLDVNRQEFADAVVASVNTFCPEHSRLIP